jgi:hypothetical protein
VDAGDITVPEPQLVARLAKAACAPVRECSPRTPDGARPATGPANGKGAALA